MRSAVGGGGSSSSSCGGGAAAAAARPQRRRPKLGVYVIVTPVHAEQVLSPGFLGVIAHFAM
jgi:hypothetical protein